MSDFLKQKPAKTAETEVKALNNDVDLWIHDMEADGVVIDVENRGNIIMHIRLNFAESENLVLQCAEGVQQVDEHRCGFDVPAKSLRRVIHLDVENLDLGSYDLKYKIEGFIRNEKGELVDAKKGTAVAELPGAPGAKSGSSTGGSSAAPTTSAPAPAATKIAGGEASGTINKSGTGAPAAPASNSSSSAAGSPWSTTTTDDIEEKKVNDHISLIIYHYEGEGYEFHVKVSDKCPASILNLDCSGSDNLTTALVGASESAGEGKLSLKIAGVSAYQAAICRLTMTDENEEGYGMAYKVSTRADSSAGANSTSGQIDIKNKKAEEEAAARKKAEEDAEKARKEAEEKAAKIKKENEERAAREAADKKKAEEEAAIKKKADEEARIEGELKKKKAAEEAAAKDAEDKKKREEERIVREGELAKKKKEEEEKKKKEAEEKDKLKQQMMEKARKEAEDAAKREEDKKRKAAEWEEERKKVAADHAAKEDVLYGEMVKKKLTPFEEREVAEAEAASAKEGDEFARDAVAKNPAMAPLKDQYAKTWKLYAFYKRRYEIEWRLRFLLIERMFWERVCSLCRDFMPQGSEIKQYKQHKVHPECYDKAPKCDQCGDILIGDYVMTKGDNPTRLHKECVLAYKNKSRPDCAKCGKKIIEDKWTTKGDQHFHSTCA